MSTGAVITLSEAQQREHEGTAFPRKVLLHIPPLYGRTDPVVGVQWFDYLRETSEYIPSWMGVAMGIDWDSSTVVPPCFERTMHGRRWFLQWCVMCEPSTNPKPLPRCVGRPLERWAAMWGDGTGPLSGPKAYCWVHGDEAFLTLTEEEWRADPTLPERWLWKLHWYEGANDFPSEEFDRARTIQQHLAELEELTNV